MKNEKKGNSASGPGHFLRKLFLLCEILFLALFFIGGGDFLNSVRGSSEESAPVMQVIPAETPEFSWGEFTAITHALGQMDGENYLNSKESFLAYYNMGCRLFEVDLSKTADGVWVCRHGWDSPLGQWHEEGERVLTAEEFLSAPIYGKYTPMTLEDLILLLKDYPDAFVMLDSKQYSIRNYQMTLEDYSEYLEIARGVDAEQVMGQFIPQIYNYAMFPGTALIYKFPTYVFSLWQEYTERELTEIAAYCREKEIPAVTVNHRRWSEDIQEIFDREGILVYVYTVNDEEEAQLYMDGGAAGICSNFLTADDFR